MSDILAQFVASLNLLLATHELCRSLLRSTITNFELEVEVCCRAARACAVYSLEIESSSSMRNKLEEVLGGRVRSRRVRHTRTLPWVLPSVKNKTGGVFSLSYIILSHLLILLLPKC